ncbi:type II toxin-antitoxin system HicA family toxin [Candidatus Sumerlaeota bacterium]|nr:type II toxin-antitoxin system HicA family toxin [Candidatus Sumerlaeota bacterium]
MNKHQKLIQKILQGQSDANISFLDLCSLMLFLGFEERIKGGHYIFRMAGVIEKVNLQKSGKLAKPYQVRQVRNVILKYKLFGE